MCFMNDSNNCDEMVVDEHNLTHTTESMTVDELSVHFVLVSQLWTPTALLLEFNSHLLLGVSKTLKVMSYRCVLICYLCHSNDNRSLLITAI